MKIEEIFQKFSECDSVEAIALGGSRANGVYDEKSDYDVYVYLNGEFPEEKRREILADYTSETEIGNKYWEYEDNCVLRNGVGMDIIYRSLDDFEKYMSYVVEEGNAGNGYTTCFWHNLVTSQIIFDRNGKFAEYQKRFTVPYPKKLKMRLTREQSVSSYTTMMTTMPFLLSPWMTAKVPFQSSESGSQMVNPFLKKCPKTSWKHTFPLKH